MTPTPPRCYVDDCPEPRVVWPSGRVATYCTAHQHEHERRYREAHPEVAERARRRYAASHPEFARDASRAFRARRPAYVREWHAAHAEDERAARQAHRQAKLEEVRMRDRDQARERRAARPGEHARTVRRWQYHLPAGAIEAMYEAQAGRCAICGEERALEGRGGLHVDHDHATGEVRGLLCSGCNASLATLERVGPTWQARAEAYLGDPPARRFRGRSGASRS